MPGAPSFIALDWGTSSLRAWRFGESPNPQEKREFPWGIVNYPPRQQHVRTLSTIRFYVSAATGWHKPHARYWLAACSAVRKGGNQQLIYLARSLSRVWRSS